VRPGSGSKPKVLRLDVAIAKRVCTGWCVVSGSAGRPSADPWAARPRGDEGVQGTAVVALAANAVARQAAAAVSGRRARRSGRRHRRTASRRCSRSHDRCRLQRVMDRRTRRVRRLVSGSCRAVRLSAVRTPTRRREAQCRRASVGREYPGARERELGRAAGGGRLGRASDGGPGRGPAAASATPSLGTGASSRCSQGPSMRPAESVSSTGFVCAMRRIDVGWLAGCRSIGVRGGILKPGGRPAEI
jgi:hypothetical protein